MKISAICCDVFEQCVKAYHQHNDVDAPAQQQFDKDSFEQLLYNKCHIDTVQWHLEDSVRDPAIDPLAGIQLKRRIDKSNQDRTDLVEKIDDYFLQQFNKVVADPSAPINTESPAWAIDRLSILVLKIWHMQEEVDREDATPEHKNRCSAKLSVLLEQRTDLSRSIDELLTDISLGRKKMKVYRQMKMYNDPSLNPILYKQGIQ
jgi:hypothetical protein